MATIGIAGAPVRCLSARGGGTAGPYEVFLESGANVYTVAEKSDTVQAAGGLSITPKYTFDNAKTRILRFGARPRMRGQQQQASR